MTWNSLLILVIALTCSPAFADSTSPVCSNTPDGIVKDYYPDGNLRTEWSCKNGHINGLTKLYYKNGNLEKESNYVNDVRQGVTTGYYKAAR